MLRGDRSSYLRFEPKRDFSVFPLRQHRFLAASDAAVEVGSPGSGGFPLIFFQPDEFGKVLWQPIAMGFKPSEPAKTHVAQLEPRPLVLGQCGCCDDLSERAL